MKSDLPPVASPSSPRIDLSLRQLQIFVTTAGLGHLTRAAHAMHMSQPALSRALAEFENRLGVRLFARTTRRLALTYEGERFLPTARRLLNDMQDAVDSVREQNAGLRGSVTIAVGTAFGTTVLPAVLQASHRSNPGVRLRVIDDNSGGITRRVATGEADIGIGSPVGATHDLSLQPLLDAPIGILMPAPAAGAGSASRTRSPDKMPLLREADDTSIMNLLRMHGSDLVARMENGIDVNSLALQLALARQGTAGAVMSALGASHPDALSMRFVPIKPAIRRTLFLMQRRDAPTSPAVRGFVARLLEAPRPSELRASIRWIAGKPASRQAS